MAGKIHSFGAILQYDLDGTPPYTALTDIARIKPPNVQVGSSEVTHLESVSAFREFQPGWGDGGEITFRCYMTKAQVAILYGFVRVLYYWRVLFPLLTGETVNSMWTAQGFITNFDSQEVTIDGEVTAMVDITLKITGKPAFAAGT